MLAKKCAQGQTKLEVPAKGNIGFQNYIVLLSRTLLAHPSLSSLIFQYKPCHRLRLFITFPRFCRLIHNCHPNITKYFLHMVGEVEAGKRGIYHVWQFWGAGFSTGKDRCSPSTPPFFEGK